MASVKKFEVPLLIVNGKFKNLSKMTVTELETFIPFMTKCTVRNAEQEGNAPQWWDKTISFKFPLEKPKGLSEMGYQRHLQAMVCRCYCYYKAHFILGFCSKVFNQPTSIFFKDNKDNTTSVYSFKNTSLILTFDNENLEYDSQTNTQKTKPHLFLLPAESSKLRNEKNSDIYLCENCDIEVYSFSEMKNHEKMCYGSGSNETSSDVQIIRHIKPGNLSGDEQSGFLNYLGLVSKSSQQQKTDLKPKFKKLESRVKRWIVLTACLQRNRRIEFSSLLGRRILEFGIKRDHIARIDRTIILNESHCVPKTSSDYRDCLRPRVVYKKTDESYKWAHKYCFTKRERKKKIKAIKSGFRFKYHSLLKQCKECRVVLTRLKLGENGMPMK